MTSESGIDALIQRIERAVAHLTAVRQRLLGDTDVPDAQWVIDNADDPLFIDRLNSFGIQLGRTAESVSKRLLPRLLTRAAEDTGSVVDNLNTAHKIGWIEYPSAWVELHRVRNTLVHEYLDDPEFMAVQIEQALPLVDQLVSDFSQLRDKATT